MKNQTRHILALSGGKDSSALAIYMLDKGIDMEYVFCDTEKELDETYEYLNKLESYLGKQITILKYSDGYGFDDILKIKNGYLPSPESRWCTEYLKLKPYEQYLSNDNVVSYVGIRADEQHRKGYISTKTNITTKFPFIEDNIRKEDVIRILKESGLGIPDYYSWRSRSGCYFCFFQQKREWVGLYEHHPELYAKAMEYEKLDPISGISYTWMQNESLKEFANPARMAQVKDNYNNKKIVNVKSNLLADILADVDDVEENGSCLICHL